METCHQYHSLCCPSPHAKLQLPFFFLFCLATSIEKCIHLCKSDVVPKTLNQIGVNTKKAAGEAQKAGAADGN